MSLSKQLLQSAVAKLTRQINKVNILGFTPLMIASKLGHVEVAKVLTQSGAISGEFCRMLPNPASSPELL